MPKYIPMADCGDADDFTRAYLECAEWCGIDEEEREAFELSVSPVWSKKTILQARGECDDFRSAADGLLEGINEERAGHDFWLTRNRHGTGFWDRGLSEIGDKLTELAHPYGEAYVTFNPESEELEIG